MPNIRTGPSLADRLAEALAPFQADELSHQEHWAMAQLLEQAVAESKRKAARALVQDVANKARMPEPVTDDPLAPATLPWPVHS
jgi:hypothetical protein